MGDPPLDPGPRLPTAFTHLLGIEHPIVQEGLGPYRTVVLAAAVSNAGGLGTISIPSLTIGVEEGARLLRGYIEEACGLTDRPLAVNVPVGSDETGVVLPFSAAYVRTVVDAVNHDAAIAKRVRMITTSAGPPSVVRHLIAGSGLVHAHKVGATRQAVRAVEDGVDVVIASGYEAGGHTHARPVHTFVLGPSVAAAVDVPVLLAGGVRDGRSLAAALALGVDGVALGTRFVASRDNPDWHPAYAQRIVNAREGDDVVFSAIYGPSRALPSRGLDELAQLQEEGTTSTDDLTVWKDERLIRAQRDGDMEHGILPAGQIAGAIDALIDVATFLPGMVNDAVDILDRLQGGIQRASAGS